MMHLWSGIFVLAGLTPITLQEECEDIDGNVGCSELCLKYGMATGGRYSGDVVQFTCDPDRKLVGTTNTTCQSNAKWTAPKPTCDYIYRCAFLTPPNAGSVSHTQGDKHTEVGGQAVFSCNTGYKLVGAAVLTCMDRGNWNNEKPRCVSKSCSVFEYINHGTITKQDPVEGGTVEFQCDEGYKMVGKSSLKCKDDNRWDGDAPRCEETTCPIVYTFKYGTVSQAKYHKGAEMKLTCHPGYTLTGSPTTITCMDSRQWSDIKPICKYARCKWVPIQRFGSIRRIGDRDWTRNMEFTCNSGYKADGPTTLNCIGTRWSSHIPPCRESMCNYVKSQYKGDIENYSRLPGATYSVQCDPGYKLKKINISTRTCNPDTLRWSESPACTQEGALLPNQYCKSIIDLRGFGRCTGSRKEGGIMKCHCDSGYKMIGADTLTCHNAAWEPPVPRCQARFCPFLRPFSGGKTYGDSNMPGAQIKYSCFEGYILEGASVLTCMDNGQWSHSPPSCKESRCTNLINVANGDVCGSGDTDGANRMITCHKGYKLVGAAVIMCTKTKWLPAVPSCIRNSCQPKSFINNGVIDGYDFTVGATLRIKCNSEYVIQGPAEITCIRRGNNIGWSASPKCTRVVCPSISKIYNGKISDYNNLPGSTTTITCSSGFQLSGSGKLTCNNKGNWDKKIPTCEKIPQCKTTCLHYGTVKYSGNRFVGDKATFECKGLDHILVGEKTVTCRADETWSAAIPTCMDHKW